MCRANVLSHLEHDLPLLSAALSEDTHLNHISLVMIFAHLPRSDVMFLLQALHINCLSTGCHCCSTQTKHKRASSCTCAEPHNPPRPPTSLPQMLLFADSKSNLSQEHESREKARKPPRPRMYSDSSYTQIIRKAYLWARNSALATHSMGWGETLNSLNVYLNRNELNYHPWKSSRSISLIMRHKFQLLPLIPVAS